MPLLWVGCTTLVPNRQAAGKGDALRLTRVASESFGVGRPMPDLMLGPRARLTYRSTRCLELLGSTQAFAPAHAFVDGDNVIEVAPLAPVRLYHLALNGQQTILANGIEVESYHPGPQIETMMDRDTVELFRGLFPHLESLDAFGPMQTPRLTAFELDALRAG